MINLEYMSSTEEKVPKLNRSANLHEILTEKDISQLLPVESRNLWTLTNILSGHRVWHRTWKSTKGVEIELFSLALRIKSSSRNLVNFIESVDTLKEWKPGLSDVKSIYVTPPDAQGNCTQVLKWKQKTKTYRAIMDSLFLNTDNVISWCLEPLLEPEYTVSRVTVKDEKFSRVYEKVENLRETTVFICQPIIGLENDQCRLTAITTGDIRKLTHECMCLMDHFAMQRAPVDTSQTPPSHVDTAGNIDGNVTTGYGDHASSQSTLKVDSLMTDKPSFYLPLDKAGQGGSALGPDSPGDSEDIVSQSSQEEHDITANSTPDQISNSVSAPQIIEREEKVEGYKSVVFLRTDSSEMVHVDFKTLSNTCAADVLAEVHNATNLVQKQKPDKTTLEPPVVNGWVFENTERGVAILQKYSQNHTPYQSWLGKGLIKATPEKVWQTIINPYSRHIYDDMLKELTLINDLGDGMKLLRLFYSTNQVLRRDCREFYVLQAQRVCENKRILTVCSFDHPEPETSGWIVEPIVSKNSNTYSIVTYLSQIDLSHPNTSGIQLFDDEFISRQPVAIAELRDYLTAFT
ncbi:hypothetical protein EB796_005355 [Bugula neritina]|uniref:START domain-containing protein n=1 Tax=Bugula neritina TaxID=10212 RepID=A0A7J7KEP8_BUGNE|nr:hypothetical protein EB796_005355 [Bugula neritina]